MHFINNKKRVIITKKRQSWSYDNTVLIECDILNKKQSIVISNNKFGKTFTVI